MIEEKKYISRATAQKRMGCTKKELRELMENGIIAFARKESGGFMIEVDSVNKYIAQKASNDNTALYNRIQQLEARVELMEDLLKRNGIQIPESLQQAEPVEPAFQSEYPPLNKLPFSGRARSVFRTGGITTVEQLAGMRSEDLIKIHGCGKKTLNEVWNFLASKGLTFEL